ncbi:MAG: histidine kinase [Acidobacteria bacterium]|nr:histidine kinase [Acidobacteriota bacterium]
MHPILHRRLRLALYLAAWSPVLALAGYAARASRDTSWLRATALAAPAMLMFAFTCLSAWYVCRVQPLRFSEWNRLALTWGAASLSAGGLLAGIAWLTAEAAHAPNLNLPLLAGVGTVLYLLSAGVHYAGIASEASREAEQREAEARNLARDAELYALRMQINPHFLFNSLHSIAALAGGDGARAREMCIRLSDFLRGSLALGERETIPLPEELALARRYLAVEQVRFGERLQVSEEVAPGCEEYGIPALLLQPLVENAVKHGVAGMIEGGTVRLAVAREDDDVVIRVENPFDPENDPPARLGIGLNHVRRRLEVRYGGRARFTAGPEGAIYRVELRFPSESPIASSSRA